MYSIFPLAYYLVWLGGTGRVGPVSEENEAFVYGMENSSPNFRNLTWEKNRSADKPQICWALIATMCRVIACIRAGRCSGSIMSRSATMPPSVAERTARRILRNARCR